MSNVVTGVIAAYLFVGGRLGNDRGNSFETMQRTRATQSVADLPRVSRANECGHSSIASHSRADLPDSNRVNAQKAQDRLSFPDRQWLTKVSDPTNRMAVVAETAENFRNTYPRLAEILKMDRSEYDRFVELYAEQKIWAYESTLRCMADDNCELSTFLNPADSMNAAIKDVLGPERSEKFRLFLSSLVERQLVTEFRGALSDSDFVSDEQAEALIQSLFEERTIQNSDLESSRHAPVARTLSVPVDIRETDTVESLRERVQDYFARLNARAEEVLTPAQFLAFKQKSKQRQLTAMSAIHVALASHTEDR